MRTDMGKYFRGAIIAMAASLPLLGMAADAPRPVEDLGAKKLRFSETAQLSLEQIRAASSEKQCEEALRILGPIMRDAHGAKERGLPWNPDMTPVREVLVTAGRKFPDTAIGLMSSTGMKVFEYFQAFDRAEFQSLIDELKTSPNPQLRELSAGFQERARIEREPMTLAATAIDGREIDLQKLRGKVVLVEFWSTGCEPCIKETPEIKRLYSKYGPQGFEVIGISLGAGLGAKERLEEFIRQHEVPWPQFCDLGGWRNRYAVQYGVKRMPTAFLLDREGKLVSADARPPNLEALVRRHLGLSP
jgi:thiol-disulfide isomerase/thioredoxin